MAKRIPEKLKNIFTDTIWSMAGLVLMNVAAQFVVYPCWNRVLGSEEYGNIVYLLAVMNILAISVGSGVNYARMRQSANGETQNRPYMLLMAAERAFRCSFCWCCISSGSCTSARRNSAFSAC